MRCNYSVLADKSIKADEVGLHFDADYVLEDLLPVGQLVHPHIATVTYLSDEGAPTLVLNCTRLLCDHHHQQHHHVTTKAGANADTGVVKRLKGII